MFVCFMMSRNCSIEFIMKFLRLGRCCSTSGIFSQKQPISQDREQFRQLTLFFLYRAVQSVRPVDDIPFVTRLSDQRLRTTLVSTESFNHNKVAQIYVILAFRRRNEVRLDVVLDEKRVVACARGAVFKLELAVQQLKRLTRHMDLPARKP